MMLTDSHAHLVSLEDIRGALDRARAEGVGKIVSIASELESAKETIVLSEKEEGIFATVGVHPHNADMTTGAMIKEFKELSTHPKVVAVGETGLDYFYMNAEKDVQINSLTEHFRLAYETDLPIVIHVREADEDLMSILANVDLRERPGVIHCFTGKYETAKKYLDFGFYISFSGIATFKKSEEIREAAKKVPTDRILIETDSPYLAPMPFRGKPNEPAYVKYTAETIAGVRSVSLQEIAEVTSANAAQLFRLA